MELTISFGEGKKKSAIEEAMMKRMEKDDSPQEEPDMAEYMKQSQENMERILKILEKLSLNIPKKTIVPYPA